MISVRARTTYDKHLSDDKECRCLSERRRKTPSLGRQHLPDYYHDYPNNEVKQQFQNDCGKSLQQLADGQSENRRLLHFLPGCRWLHHASSRGYSLWNSLHRSSPEHSRRELRALHPFRPEESDRSNLTIFWPALHFQWLHILRIEPLFSLKRSQEVKEDGESSAKPRIPAYFRCQQRDAERRLK